MSGWRAPRFQLALAAGLVALAACLPLLAAGLLLLAGWVGARLLGRARRLRRDRAVAAALPVLVDQLHLAAAAGLPVAAALTVVEPRAPPAVRPALSGARRRIAHGAALADALWAVAPELGTRGEPVVRALVDAARTGQPLVPVLARLAADGHDRSARDAEAAARRLPVLLLLPLAGCVLPAAVLLAVVPVVAASLDHLHL